MSETLTDRDLHLILDVVDATNETPDFTGGVPSAVMETLVRLVPSDSLAFLDFEYAAKTLYAGQWLMTGEPAAVSEPLIEPDQPLYVYSPVEPLCSYAMHTGDHRSITLRTDFYTDLEFRNTDVYQLLMRDAPIHQLLCWMPVKQTRTPRFLFWRDVDFTERDRLVMSLVRPHLTEMYVRSQQQVRTRMLTPRQLELMQLVAAGRSTADIAAELFLSPATVRKHLENIFERLGVTSRGAAVSRVFGTG